MAGLLVTTRKNDCLSSRLVLRRGATANLSTTISVPVMALQKWATFPQACRQPSRKIAREFSSRRSDCSPEFRKGSSMISLVARSEHSKRPPLISDVIFRLDANVYTLFSFLVKISGDDRRRMLLVGGKEKRRRKIRSLHRVTTNGVANGAWTSRELAIV